MKEATIDRTKVLMELNQDNKTIHILDLNNGMSLTNALNMNICKQVLESYGIVWMRILEYHFICYHTDNEISEFHPETEGFSILSPTNELVNPEFSKEMFYLYG